VRNERTSVGPLEWHFRTSRETLLAKPLADSNKKPGLLVPWHFHNVASNAYATDYKRPEDYVAKFPDHIDWHTVAKRYHRVDRM
jgi:superoxide dismutase